MRRLFEVYSEPHTGARPSVRLFVGLKMRAARKRNGGGGQLRFLHCLHIPRPPLQNFRTAPGCFFSRATRGLGLFGALYTILFALRSELLEFICVLIYIWVASREIFQQKAATSRTATFYRIYLLRTLDSRGGGRKKVENLCDCFLYFVAFILPVGLRKNKTTPSGRKTARMVSSQGV